MGIDVASDMSTAQRGGDEVDHLRAEVERLTKDAIALKSSCEIMEDAMTRAVCERDAMSREVERLKRERNAARTAALIEAASRLDERGFREAACVVSAAVNGENATAERRLVGPPPMVQELEQHAKDAAIRAAREV